MHLLLGEVSTIVVSSPEIAEQVMKTHDLVFAQRPCLLASRIVSYGSTNIGFSPYGEYWRQLRKICTTELLSSKRVETFRGIREEEVMNFVRDISSNTGSAINLSKRIYSHTYGVTARAAFGKKNRDQEEFMEAMDEVVALYGGFNVADMYPSVKLLQVMSGMRRKLEKLHKRVDQILENIVNEHREKKTQRESGRGEAEDLVDVLLRVQKDGELEFPLTDDNIKAVILMHNGFTYSSTNIGFSPDDEYFRQFRKIYTTELLSSKRVKTFQEIREKKLMNFVKDILSNIGSAINLSKRISLHIYGVTAFGKKSRDQEAFIEAMKEIVALYGGFSVTYMYPSVKLLQAMNGMRDKLEKLHKRVDQILGNLVKKHRARESGRGEAEDLVDVLLRV
ncbi:Cytochrome P450 71D8 [Camellia lanceoleosa]|uniref:Cytochrome P450 71D8 n=1 Tax=Camellia lanceoleosa TaxID=1840588 RepID=A0ACC0H3I4_9ERIC|nr:Cytochrome P450 71D8 [Camellia lanceoleosa]